MVQETEDELGNVTVLVNIAGILGPIATTVDLTEEDYNRVCSVNQHSQFLGMKAVIASMQRAGIGSIVNISSLARLRANYGFPSLVYVASNFATRGMTKAAAQEYGPENIRVNSVHPCFINTPMMVEATDEGGGDAVAQIFLGRLAEPDEVSSLVLSSRRTSRRASPGPSTRSTPACQPPEPTTPRLLSAQRAQDMRWADQQVAAQLEKKISYAWCVSKYSRTSCRRPSGATRTTKTPAGS